MASCKSGSGAGAWGSPPPDQEARFRYINYLITPFPARREPVSPVEEAAPRYDIVKAKLARPDRPLDQVYAGLRRRWPDGAADAQDGLRLAWPDRWIHVRPSGTEPVVRVIAEAPSADAAQGMVDDGRQTLLTMGA